MVRCRRNGPSGGQRIGVRVNRITLKQMINLSEGSRPARRVMLRRRCTPNTQVRQQKFSESFPSKSCSSMQKRVCKYMPGTGTGSGRSVVHNRLEPSRKSCPGVGASSAEVLMQTARSRGPTCCARQHSYLSKKGFYLDGKRQAGKNTKAQASATTTSILIPLPSANGKMIR